jgi:hypothetical protein
MPATVERNSPEKIHPAIWRASQLARKRPLDRDWLCIAFAELPGGGWPLGALIELLPPAFLNRRIEALATSSFFVGKETHRTDRAGTSAKRTGTRGDRVAARLRRSGQSAEDGGQTPGCGAAAQGRQLRGAGALASAGSPCIAETASPRGTVVRDTVCCGTAGNYGSRGLTSHTSPRPTPNRGGLRDRHPQATRLGGCKAADDYSAESDALFTPPASMRSYADYGASGRGSN